MKNSLQTRIAFSMWVLAIAGIFVSAFLTGSLLLRSHHDSVRRQLETSAASLLAMQISDFSELDDLDQFNLFIEDALEMEKVETIVRVFDHKRKLLFSTLKSNPVYFPETIQKIDKPTFYTFDGEDRDYEALVIPYEVNKKEGEFFLEVMQPLPRYSQILQNLWWESLLFMIVLAALSYLMSRNLTRRLLAPVTQIAHHLEKMDPNHIETWQKMEVGKRGLYLTSIVNGINSLAEKTKSSVFELRKMSRYVAHELRTPLTILQGEAETVLSSPQSSKSDYERVLKSSLDEIQNMSEIVTTVLQIGEWERAVALYKPISLDLVSWILENKPRWEKTLGWKLETPEKRTDVIVSADPKLLFYLVDNLIRNIRTHTPAQTPCSIEVRKLENSVVLSISDQGSGLSEKLLQALANQNDGASLSGVGLNLCQKIASISELSLLFKNKSTGGLLVEVVFGQILK
ncbi:MAG: hypothetical protein IPJ69_08940 [Deltaproteobacteria bacterium]|nr:MAG: hypothetical protein IPJ69_08940 [Deltaproteobacteria bacterium]